MFPRTVIGLVLVVTACHQSPDVGRQENRHPDIPNNFTLSSEKMGEIEIVIHLDQMNLWIESNLLLIQQTVNDGEQAYIVLPTLDQGHSVHAVVEPGTYRLVASDFNGQEMKESMRCRTPSGYKDCILASTEPNPIKVIAGKLVTVTPTVTVLSPPL